MKQEIKVGDLVRVGRQPACHSMPFGAVCSVVQLGGWMGDVPRFVLVETGDRKQSVYISQVTAAQQATKKREQYQNRR
jgi:hypothetical protein